MLRVNVLLLVGIALMVTACAGLAPTPVPTMRDRAAQTLVKLALEPEWEAKFEPNSYGFRPGRSTHDAIEAIPSASSGQAPTASPMTL